MKAVYGKDFYQGMPALTVNQFGAGQAWYVASSPEPAFLQGLLGNLCRDKGIAAPIAPVPGVEVSVRTSSEDESFVFILNHNDQAASVALGDLKGRDLISGEMMAGDVTLAPKQVLIIAK
ncbi:Beta-galactosidase BgaP [compost metagenome]